MSDTNLPAQPDRKVPLAIVFYDPDAPENCEMSVGVTTFASAFIKNLTDGQLAIFASEAGLRVRRALEKPLPPKEEEPRIIVP